MLSATVHVVAVSDIDMVECVTFVLNICSIERLKRINSTGYIITLTTQSFGIRLVYLSVVLVLK